YLACRYAINRRSRSDPVSISGYKRSHRSIHKLFPGAGTGFRLGVPRPAAQSGKKMDPQPAGMLAGQRAKAHALSARETLQCNSHAESPLRYTSDQQVATVPTLLASARPTYYVPLGTKYLVREWYSG